MNRLGIMLMAALLAIAPGYASAQPQGKKETAPATQPQTPEVKAEPAGAAKTFTPEERQAYEKKTAAELEAMEKNIGDLGQKVNKIVPQKKRMVIKIIKSLQLQTMDARKQLAALEKAPENAWGGLKPGMDRAMAELRKAWDEAEPHLK